MSASSSMASRPLNILGEFKPFGLVVEALDGNPAEIAGHDYHYFLFDPKLTRDQDEISYSGISADADDHGDHELFIRRKRIIWSSGTRVQRRYSFPGQIIMACWCRMDTLSEALLCVLQTNTLAIYRMSGEMTCLPLCSGVTSIWPLPFGLLLQRTAGHEDFPVSHLILKHPLEEPQVIFVEEKRKQYVMSDFDEKVIWTTDVAPLVASYNRGKMQHSLWLVSYTGENRSKVEIRFLLQKLWHGSCFNFAATKVFLATDMDGVPIICFLFQERKDLLSVRLQVDEHNNILCDVESHIIWSFPAVAAAPVIMTRPRTKCGNLPFMDVIILDVDNELLLYSGKTCLCKFYLPLTKDLFSSCLGSPSGEALIDDAKILNLADAVGERINVTLSNGKLYRCTLRPSIACSLTNDCITAMADGMQPSLYSHFLRLLWAHTDSCYLLDAEFHAGSEWEAFSSVILKLCGNFDLLQECASKPSCDLSWEFLLSSAFHMNYKKQAFLSDFHFASPPIKLMLQIGESKENKLLKELLADTLDSLHAVYESLKLHILRLRDACLLVNVVCNVAASLGEAGYVDYYLREFPILSRQCGNLCLTEDSRRPPSVLHWLECCLLNELGSTNVNDLPNLICRSGSSAVSWARKIVSFYSVLFNSERIGGDLSTGLPVRIIAGSASNPEERTILAMAGEGFYLPQLELLPPGVSLPLRHALDKCRDSPPTDWPAVAYVLVGREDLAARCMARTGRLKGNLKKYDADLTFISDPYMLHICPVMAPSEITGSEEVKVVDTDTDDGFVFDGMEHMLNLNTQLRFGRDLRLKEVRRLLCSARHVSLKISASPGSSDQEMQQLQLWQLAQRTMALPFGRGAFTLATTCALMTEPFVFPKLILAGRLPAQQNVTVNLDANARNMSELILWPEFHNAVAAGLRLDPVQSKVSRTWITYNRPEQLNAAHAGLLYALGLHGHLRALTIADVYKYLTPENETTIVGVLLGMSASYRGTMHPSVSKLLYLHLPFRRPSLPDLELPTLVQSAALVALGLLYEGSAHPISMELLLNELGQRSCGDNVLEREGYAVAAGFALGLVSLGQGNASFAFKDWIVEHLFQYLGGRDLQNDTSLLKMRSVDHNFLSIGKVVDSAIINFDVTAPGATLALALMFLKTECEEIASRICVPQTRFGLLCVRPDFILLRVIAQNMIMWSRIDPSDCWLNSQIPDMIKSGLIAMRKETIDVGKMEIEAVCQSYINIMTGACISLGLKYAGTRNADAQELLYRQVMSLLDEMKHASIITGKSSLYGLVHYVDRPTLETCLHLIVLSLSVVMAGSGHLRLFRLLRYLRKRNLTDAHTSFGIQMAVNLSIGFLFLGGGTKSFSRKSNAVAALLISLYPRFPTGPSDNRCYLQAFRHLFALAAESRLVQTVDVDTGLPVYVPLQVTIKETKQHCETSFCEITPCILPEHAVLKSVQVCGPRYWHQLIANDGEDKPWWSYGDFCDPFNGGVIFVKRKVGACSYMNDPSGCQSLLSRLHKVSDMTSPGYSGDHGYPVSSLEPSSFEQLISTFSPNPSLVAFSQLLADCSASKRSRDEFDEYSLRVLFECVSKDKPAFIKIYLSLYESVDSMAKRDAGTHKYENSFFLSNLKVAMAYTEAVLKRCLGEQNEGIVQLVFIQALCRRVDNILQASIADGILIKYLKEGIWPQDEIESVLLSWYLRWYELPQPFTLKMIFEKLGYGSPSASYSLPLISLLLPSAPACALFKIHELCMRMS